MKTGEREGIVSQGLDEIRNIAPVSKEDLICCWHAERLNCLLVSERRVWLNDKLWVWVCALSLRLLSNFAAGLITGTLACVQTTCVTMRAGSHAPKRCWLADSSIKGCQSRGRANHNAGGGFMGQNKNTMFGEHISPPRTAARGGRQRKSAARGQVQPGYPRHLATCLSSALKATTWAWRDN